MPDAEHALDVIPNGPPESGRVDVFFRAHRVVGEVVGEPEFVVHQVSDVVVEAVDEREGVVVPRIVLHAERGDRRHFAAACEILNRDN